MARDLSLIRTLQQAVLLAAGNQAVTGRLADALAALGAAEDVSSALGEYRAALLEAAHLTETGMRELLTSVAAAPVSFLGPVHEAARVLIDTARTRGLDLAEEIDLGPAGLSLIASAVLLRTDPPPPARATSHLLGHLPVGGLAARLDLGPVRAAGAGYLDPTRRNAGALLTADLGPARVDVVLLLDARGPLSVLALLRADLGPSGIQLGLGFSLDAVGGIVGLNRTVDGPVLRDRLADGSGLEAIFGGGYSPDEIRGTLRSLEGVFPARPGTHVVGPTLRLGWLNLGGRSLARLDVGVILEIPSGRVILPGRVVVQVPGPGTPLLHLRLDVLGEVDPAGQRLAADAALVDSYVLGSFAITGTAALRMAWGDHALVLATLGGFYPGFSPAPAVVPPQRRISIGLKSPVPVGLTISLEGYAAVTAGTLQAGATLSLAFRVPLANLSGSAGFDAIVQLSPLWLEASVFGSVSLRALGEELVSVNLRGHLTGPGPLVFSGEAYGKIGPFKVGGRKSFTLAGGAGADREPFDGLAGLVARELHTGANVSGEGGGDPDVVLAPRPRADDAALLAPGATLVWAQEAFPLDAPFTRAGGHTLRQPSAVRVRTTGPSPAPVHRRLTSAAFTTITPANTLTVPPFDHREVGWRLTPVTTSSALSHSAVTTHRTVRLPVVDLTPRWLDSPDVGTPYRIVAALRTLDQPAALGAGVDPAVTVDDEQWAIVEPAGQAVVGQHHSGAAAHATVTLHPAAQVIPTVALDQVTLP